MWFLRGLDPSRFLSHTTPRSFPVFRNSSIIQGGKNRVSIISSSRGNFARFVHRVPSNLRHRGTLLRVRVIRQFVRWSVLNVLRRSRHSNHPLRLPPERHVRVTIKRFRRIRVTRGLISCDVVFFVRPTLHVKRPTRQS